MFNPIEWAIQHLIANFPGALLHLILGIKAVAANPFCIEETMLKRRRNGESKKQDSTPKCRQRSRRLQGLPAQTTNFLKCDLGVKLPLELQISVLECLEKQDLKQVRLVSRVWCSLSIPLLFNKIYISPQPLDLQVFQSCAAHPDISKAVREIVYDVSHFDGGTSRETYGERLATDFTMIFYRKPFESPSHPFHHYINELISFDVRLADVCSKHEQDAFLIEGHEAWEQRAEYEHQAIGKGELYRILCFGLCNFKYLRSIRVTDLLFYTNLNETAKLDKSTLKCKYSGSPVTRNWTSTHLRPTRMQNSTSNIDLHFQIITYALAGARVSVPSLRFLHSRFGEDSTNIALPVTTLVTAKLDRMLYRICIDAYRDSESFALRVVTEKEDDCTSADTLGVLPDMLYKMKALKHLALTLSRPDVSSHRWYKYEQLFRGRKIWHNLVSVEFSGLSIKASHLVLLLNQQIPRLRKLSLFQIELLDGAWEGVIRTLRSRGLVEFSLPIHTSLTYPGGFLFDHDDFTDAIEHYILCGGRHPCLPRDCESQAADGYYWTLFSGDDMREFQRLQFAEGMTCPPNPGSIIPVVPWPPLDD